MIELSKKTRKELRAALSLAYSRELDRYLLELSTKFDAWKSKKIDCWALSDHIHAFHNGISKKLFNFYNASGVDNIYMVARGLAENLLTKDEIPTEALEFVERTAETFFSHDE